MDKVSIVPSILNEIKFRRFASILALIGAWTYAMNQAWLEDKYAAITFGVVSVGVMLFVIADTYQQVRSQLLTK